MFKIYFKNIFPLANNFTNMTLKMKGKNIVKHIFLNYYSKNGEKCLGTASRFPPKFLDISCLENNMGIYAYGI